MLTPGYGSGLLYVDSAYPWRGVPCAGLPGPPSPGMGERGAPTSVRPRGAGIRVLPAPCCECEITDCTSAFSIPPRPLLHPLRTPSSPASSSRLGNPTGRVPSRPHGFCKAPATQETEKCGAPAPVRRPLNSAGCCPATTTHHHHHSPPPMRANPHRRPGSPRALQSCDVLSQRCAREGKERQEVGPWPRCGGTPGGFLHLCSEQHPEKPRSDACPNSEHSRACPTPEQCWLEDWATVGDVSLF